MADRSPCLNTPHLTKSRLQKGHLSHSITTHEALGSSGPVLSII